MATEKIKFALRITPETQKLVKDLCPRDNCQSQNEFIDKAIRFYAGYLSAKDAVEVLPPALVAALKGTVQDSEGRIARLLFKLAVEITQAMKIPLEQFRWYAAFHNEGHHPHVHMVCYSADGKSGFLTKDGLAKIKSGLAKEIFRQELTEIYSRQTQC